MSDDELDLDELESSEEDGKREAEAAAAAAANAKAKAEKEAAEAAAKARAEAEAAEQIAGVLVSLRNAWADQLKSEFPLADYSNIGIAGTDDAAKEKFRSDVAASQEARQAEFKKLGLVFDPARAGEAGEDARDAQAAQDWGSPVAGGKGASDKEEYDNALRELVSRGDVQGATKLMLGHGGLAKMFKRNKT